MGLHHQPAEQTVALEQLEHLARHERIEIFDASVDHAYMLAVRARQANVMAAFTQSRQQPTELGLLAAHHVRYLVLIEGT
ncbi:hypothetical protein D9M70_609690 [compost metagenome]